MWCVSPNKQMSALILDNMRPEHLAAVAELEHLCFGSGWTPTNFRKELDNPRCSYFVAQGSGRLAGYLGYWQILEEAHITSVGVHPEFRRQRIAQLLMCRMLEECAAKGIKWITLEVKASNIQAQNLYQKFGFAVMGRRKNYYQAEREDALIMWTEDVSESAFQQRLQALRSEIQDIEIQERSIS